MRRSRLLLFVLLCYGIGLKAQITAPPKVEYAFENDSLRYYLSTEYSDKTGIRLTLVEDDSDTLVDWSSPQNHNNGFVVISAFDTSVSVPLRDQKKYTLYFKIRDLTDSSTSEIYDYNVIPNSDSAAKRSQGIFIAYDSTDAIYFYFTNRDDSKIYNASLLSKNRDTVRVFDNIKSGDIRKVNMAELDQDGYFLNYGNSAKGFYVVQTQTSRQNTKSETAAVDWSQIDTSQNFFEDLTLDKLNKAVILTQIVMEKNEGLDFESRARSLQVDEIAHELMMYWASRAGRDWKAAFDSLSKEANFVHNEFKANGKSGVLTKIGRTWLHYGKPDQVIESTNEKGVHPYKLLIYNPTFGHSSRRVFLFTAPYGSEEYRLIYSTEETVPDKWEYVLFADPESSGNQSSNIYLKMQSIINQ